MKKVVPNEKKDLIKKDKKANSSYNEIEGAIYNVVSDNSSGKTFQIIVTSIALCIGLVFYLLGYENLLTLLVLVAGAFWNYFTDSNKLLACLFSFLVCIPYALYSVFNGLYGQAFLHLILYIPTQLMFYYNEKDNASQKIKITKRLTKTSMTFVCLFSVVLAAGMCAILYNLDKENLFWFDSISVVLLAVSVFLINGKFAEYYIERIFAVLTSFALWFSLGMQTGWPEGTLMFSLLFAMYFVVDLYRTVVFYANAKLDSDYNEKKIKELKKFNDLNNRNKKLPN